jgi:acyl-CoA synthetase (AMP-forming)/AMP-acid ligase II/peptidoglycan/LPS O-acetylase OafA/YrhL
MSHGRSRTKRDKTIRSQTSKLLQAIIQSIPSQDTRQVKKTSHKINNTNKQNKATIAKKKVKKMFRFGKPHPTLQEFECLTKDFDSLMISLPDDENPFLNWQTKEELSISIKSSDFTSWFADDDHCVFHPLQNDEESSSERPSSLTYGDLHKCISSCPAYHSGTIVVAVLLPSCMMAEMAVVLVSLWAQSNVCIAPLDYNLPQTKLHQALKQLKCHGIVTTKEQLDKINFKSPQEYKFYDVRVVSATGDKVGAVKWTVIYQEPIPNNDFQEVQLTDERPSMLLRTSGTTSTPKVVPLTASSLLYNATCIATSLRLQRDDVGCNSMPLHHIGGVSCPFLAVLLSGSSIVMMGQFDPDAFLDCLSTTTMDSTPTWYYGVPSMHKALVLTAKTRLDRYQDHYIPNKLRFIRSGAANLPHESAVELAKVFRTKVIPTYSMSEAMPICSSHFTPVISDSNDENLRSIVGQPIGCSLRIIDEHGNTLPYGSTGEVALMGAGVINNYSAIKKSETHTPDGWLLTGDVAKMNLDGNVTLKGRQKEMIKRGGEQVWPNEVDNVVENVKGVVTAVSFGVPNELWGEEVAVTVVLDSDGTSVDDIAMKSRIMDACQEELESFAIPRQIIILPSANELIKGPTGKFLRSKLASHLGVSPVDTGALHAFKARAQGDVHKALTPSSALNGVRFIAACFVVQTHIGFYPNSAWLKIQSFTLDMQIFFILGGFQLACSIKDSVCPNWAHWVGTKIGSMHALFVVTQSIALPSYLLFQCGENGFLEKFEDSTCKEHLKGFLPIFLIQTATGMVPTEDAVNAPAWFQSAFYMYLMLFPPLDGHLRKFGFRSLLWRLILNLVIATCFFVFMELYVHFYILEYLVIGWLPTLVSAMILGYYFTRYSVDGNSMEETTSWFLRSWVQGVITDLLSITFLMFEVITALSPGCLYLDTKVYEEMRPGKGLPDNKVVFGDTEYVYACNLTYDEFVEYIHDDPNGLYNGRWPTTFGSIMGWAKAATPLVLLWIYGMAHGQGLTVRIMNLKLLQWLVPLAYPLYLLHLPIARYYWIATRGYDARFWWPWVSFYYAVCDCDKCLFFTSENSFTFITVFSFCIGCVVPCSS